MRPATSAEDLGVYVHVPFCERVCPYCDFAVEGVGPLAPEVEDAYADRLERELEIGLEVLADALSGRPLATVYFGGGTPSLLRASTVERLLERLSRIFPGPPQEVTLELNPGRTERTRVGELRAAGVTRLSIGLQSLRDPVLKALGRAHKASEALPVLDASLAAGFDSLSVDLIYGAPRQSEHDLSQDLDAVVALGFPHVSAYALTIEPDTPFARARERLALPSEETVVHMGELVCDRLSQAGLERYEISNYARPGHASRHNQRYWLREAVLGLGVAAASLVGNRRFQNHRARARWEAAVDSGVRPLASCEQLGEEEERRETLYLGLRRLEGVSRDRYSRRFGVEPEDCFGPEFAELRTLGLVEDRARHLRLTERGILFADEVFLRFV
ncbi:MAG: radical SAM family heme chaperone HemW [Myxococcota bacterium]